ncbi:Phosphoglucosamine mutase [compost metagenome]
MKQYPQVLVNVRVQDKSKYVGNVAIEQAITEVENKLSDNGRVLVRPSGTESLIRVMAEGPEKQELEELVGQIVAVVEKELV